MLHMKAGDGENSYAKNSSLQKVVMQKARAVLEYTLNDMFNGSIPKCLKMADLGCSSGPNTLMLISQTKRIVHGLCQKGGHHSAPQLQVFLNDLPDNDFNTLFKLCERFKKEREEELEGCFISAVAGSFYNRLFPNNCLHCFHSSYSLHWLSQVPKGLENNKGNIYIGKTSPADVFEAYLQQFQDDFSTFLSLRSREMKPGGRLVLTFLGRSAADPTAKDCRCLFELLATSLLDMVAEGLIEGADKVDSFNLQFYTPYKDEVEAIVEKEGSFKLAKLEVFEVNWYANDQPEADRHDVFNKHESGKSVAKCVRAVTEPILASHFGDSVIDKVFDRYAMLVGEHLSIEDTKHFNIAVSLTKL